MARRVRSGLEVLRGRPHPAKGLRVGLVANPASIDADLVPASDVLGRLRGVRLVALFGPEHGISADAQDLVEVRNSSEPRSGLPIYSLYGETRVPTPKMLEGLDAVVIDLQDVGSRYYTYIYTMLHVLEACAREHEDPGELEDALHACRIPPLLTGRRLRRSIARSAPRTHP